MTYTVIVAQAFPIEETKCELEIQKAEHLKILVPDVISSQFLKVVAAKKYIQVKTLDKKGVQQTGELYLPLGRYLHVQGDIHRSPAVKKRLIFQLRKNVLEYFCFFAFATNYRRQIIQQRPWAWNTQVRIHYSNGPLET